MGTGGEWDGGRGGVGLNGTEAERGRRLNGDGGRERLEAE